MKLLSGCWKKDNNIHNWATVEATEQNNLPVLHSSHDLKFLDHIDRNHTPICTLGITPTEEEFEELKLKEKLDVTIVMLIFLYSSL